MTLYSRKFSCPVIFSAFLALVGVDLHAQQITPLPQVGLTTPLVQAKDGTFYGTANTAFIDGSSQVIFKMTPTGSVTTLFSFPPADYNGPATPVGNGTSSRLVAGTDGNLYGMNGSGGMYSKGTIFKVTPTGTATAVYNLGTTSGDGWGAGDVLPVGLVQGSDSFLYGVTGHGGVENPPGAGGYGTIFKVSTQGAYQLLHQFKDGTVTGDGYSPVGSLVMGLDKNYYGVTYFGGAGQTATQNGNGIAYRITSTGSMTLLHSFGDGSVANDAIHPATGLVQDALGNFWGISSGGGSAGLGAIYRMAPTGAVTILHSFGAGALSYDGAIDQNVPIVSLVVGSDGNLYGSTDGGGFYGSGALFKMTPQGTFTVVYSINNAMTTIGTKPLACLSQGFDGNFYEGTSTGVNYQNGSTYNNVGTLFKLSLSPAFTSPMTTTFLAGTTNSFMVIAPGVPSPTYGATGTPSWANFNATTGMLVGAPPGTSGAPYVMTFSASNGLGSPVTQNFTLNVTTASAPPSITSVPQAFTYLAMGLPFSFTYQATGTPPPNFTRASGNFPPGVTLALGGVLSGTPTQTGTFTGTVQASNGVGSAVTQAFTFIVQQPATITSGTPPNGLVGATYSFKLQATGDPAPNYFDMTSLPQGLSLSTTTGVLSGTATETGSFTGQAYASNGVGVPAAQRYTLVISQPPAFTNVLPAGPISAQAFFTFTFQATGFPAPTFALASGALPQGLTLSPAGVLSGVPTQSGTFAGTITASNGTGPAAAQNFNLTVTPNPLLHYKIVHTFGTGNPVGDGSAPVAPLVCDNSGNFYGTASNTYSGGTIFKLSVSGTLTVLHTFGNVANDGLTPLSLVLGTDGNLYGIAQYGGANGVGNGSLGYGTAFKITPGGTFTILHQFGSGTSDPIGPISLILGWDGNFYGLTTGAGATVPSGIFKMTPSGQVTTLASIGGILPNSLIQGFDGNFYGTTSQGGIQFGFGKGTVFKVTPQGQVTFLHNFGDGTVSNDGTSPSGLIQAQDGNFYGTTAGGGASGNGTVFRMTPLGAVTILKSFYDGTLTIDGEQPSGLFQASDGNFYGTTYTGSSGAVEGITYRITPQGVYNVLHIFSDGGVASDGAFGAPPLIQGLDGLLYGPTSSGGSANQGTIYSMDLGLPPPVPPTISSAASTIFANNALNTFAVTTTGNPKPLVIASGLPSWAVLNPVSGILTGMPPSGAGSPFSILLSAYNVGFRTSMPFTLSVNAPPLIDNNPPPGGGVGLGFSFSYHASSSPASTFTVSAGALPPGLTLSSTGNLSGTPTVTGTFTGTVQADNGNKPASTQDFSILISTPEAPIFANSPPASVLLGSSVAFAYQLAAGTYPAATFSVASGSLPPGVSLMYWGALTGTPTQVGTYTGTIKASNGINPDATQSFSIAVVQAPVNFTSPTPNPIVLTVGQSYTYTYFVTGYPAPVYSLPSGSLLPPGITMNATTGIMTGTANQAGSYTGTLTASNGVNPSVNLPYNFAISGPDIIGPGVTITSPGDGFVVTKPNQTITGIAFDDGYGKNGIASVVVNGIPATNGTATGAATANWSAAITLTPGINTVTAVAKDTLGNTSSRSITVTYTVAPVIANLFWDRTTTPGLGNGSGVWDTGNTATWSDSSTGTNNPLLKWLDDSNAFFQTGSPFTATVASGSIIKLGNLNQTGTNTAATITGGTLLIDGAGISNAAGTLTINSALMLNQPTVSIDNETTAGSIILNGVISETGGSRALSKTGAGVLQLGTSANTFTGGLEINSTSEVIFYNNASFGTGPITFNGGTSLTTLAHIHTSSTSGVTSLTNNLLVTAGSFGAYTGDHTIVLSGNLLNTGAPNGTFFIFTGTHAATVTLTGDNHAFNGTVAYYDNGATTLLLGSTTAGSANALWTFTGGATKGIGANVSGSNTFQLGEVTSASGVGRFYNNQATGTATFQLGDQTTNSPRFSGFFVDGTAGGQVAVTKVGTDIQTLSNANTYTGPTSVNGGTLLISNSLAEGSTVTVNSGGTFGGTGKINGATNVTSGGIIAPGGTGIVGTLNLAGPLNLNAGSVLAFDLATTAASDKLALTGGYVAPSSGTTTINFNALAGFGTGTYTLITGVTGISASSFTLGVTPAGYGCKLSTSGSTLSVTVSLAPAAPAAPTGLMATGVSAGINLAWTASNGATSYSVLRSTTSGTGFTQIATNLTGTKFSDSGLTNGMSYYYVVTATNTGGTSVFSSQASAMPGSTAILDSWLDNDIGTVGFSGSSTYSAGTFTLSGSGAGIGLMTDGLDFTYQPLVGDGCIIAKVITRSAGESGVMIRETLGNNARFAAVLLKQSGGASFYYRTSPGSSTLTGPALSSINVPYWAKLARVGDVIRGYISPDGVTWTQIDTVTDVMAASVDIGLMQSSQSNSTTSTATFTNVSIVPASVWSSQDIGAVPIVGASSYSNAVATINGSGSDIGGTADQFRYTYLPANGNCDITARVTAISNSNGAAKAGIMIRDTLTAGARHASLFVTPASGLLFQWRATADAASASSAAIPGITAPYWIRLVRTNNTFTASYSADGNTWTTLGSQTITMGANLYIGLPVSSLNSSTLCTASFDNITATP